MSTLPPNRPTARLSVEKLEDRVNPDGNYASGVVLVGLTPGQEATSIAQMSGTGLYGGSRHLGFNVYKVTLGPGVAVNSAVTRFAGLPGVRYAEPDYIGQRAALPNDPMVQDGTQWGVNNFGQNGGVAGADIKASAGWNFSRGTGQTVVAVLDDGVDYTHPDLAGNMWRNPGEVAGNGVDDDGNGYVDDVHGIGVVANNGDPMPAGTDAHGTHVSGTIGAVGNNGIGVSGVAQRTRIMGVNIFQASGGYLVSDEITGVAYAVANGAKVLNGSIGGTYGFLQSEFDAYNGARAAGVIAIIAAGNSSLNIDGGTSFPAGLSVSLDNVVTIAAVDRTDSMSSFSNYGPQTVNIAAPGSDVMSTVRNGQYQLFNGTSMATPHVAGAVTVFWDANPTATYQEVIAALKQSARPLPALVNRVSTSGTLDLDKFLSLGGSTVYATGAGQGGGPHVKVYRGGGVEIASFYAYDAKFTGGVRVATGDVNGDRTADIVTVAGPGGGPHVKVFDGRTFQEIASFFAFEPGFTGGLTVATGDVNADGLMDVIVGADRGGGPRVSVFSQLTAGGAFTRIADFFAYDPGFRGGVNVAAGVFTAGGKQADVVTAPGRGGGPHVRRFSAAALLAGRATVVSEAMVGDPNDRSGLFVSTGDLNGDKVADVITGAASGDPVVRMSNGSNMAPMGVMRNPFTGQLAGLMDPADPLFATAWTSPTLLNGLLPPGTAPSALVSTDALAKPGVAAGFMFGARVAAQDINGDKVADIIVAGGPNDAPTVALVNGADLSVIRNFAAYDPAFSGGVFVGAAGV